MTLDEHLDDIGAMIAALPRWKRGLVITCSAERHFPLYAEFATQSKWGSSALMRSCLDQVWSLAEFGAQPGVTDALEAIIMPIVPHADDFHEASTLFAQDTAILVIDASAHFDAAKDDIASVPLWYLYETVVAASWHQRCGRYGWDSAESAVAQGFLAQAPLVKAESTRILADVASVTDQHSVRSTLVKEVRARAAAAAHTLVRLGVLDEDSRDR